MNKNVSEQYCLMKEGKSFRVDEFLYGKQAECSKLLVKINSLPFGNSRRGKLLKKLLGHFGINSVIKEALTCNYGFNISIGNSCYINHDVTILDSFEVSIGNNVFIAPKVVISPVTHPLEAKDRRNLTGKKVVIEDDVWICAGAVILPGVTIHKGAVIAAGAVVKKDVEANTVVGGIPAKFIKKIKN